jgi:hypothetical protein
MKIVNHPKDTFYNSLKYVNGDRYNGELNCLKISTDFKYNKDEVRLIDQNRNYHDEYLEIIDAYDDGPHYTMRFRINGISGTKPLTLFFVVIPGGIVSNSILVKTKKLKSKKEQNQRNTKTKTPRKTIIKKRKYDRGDAFVPMDYTPKKIIKNEELDELHDFFFPKDLFANDPYPLEVGPLDKLSEVDLGENVLEIDEEIPELFEDLEPFFD